jgi:hypothetical protein
MLILYSESSAIGEYLHRATIMSNLALKLFVITEGESYAPHPSPASMAFDIAVPR